MTAAAEAELDALLRGEVPLHAVPVITRFVRRVLRCELPDGRVVYAKQHLFPSLRVRLRYAGRASPTRHEAAMLEAARTCGLVVPRVIAERTSRGVLGPRQAVLVTEAIPPGPPPGPRDQLSAALALADHGFFHPDLHPDNLRLVDGRPAYLDFQSCRRQRRPVGGRRRLLMVAKLAVSLLADLGPERVSCLLAELGLPAAAVLRHAARLHARQIASARRHRLRSSTRTVVEPAGTGGRRVRLRGAELPCEYGRELAVTRPELGRLRVASSVDGSVLRVRRRGGLREVWLAAGVPPLAPEILAWERDGPWPWCMQALYIRTRMGGVDVAMALDRSLAWFVARTESGPRRPGGGR